MTDVRDEPRAGRESVVGSTPNESSDLKAEAGSREQEEKAEKKEKKVYEAGGIIIYESKVVLRLTDEQRWIFPKGKVKKHETPVEAAIREAVEETGLTVEVIGEAGEFIMKHEGKKRRFVFYLMRATGQTWDWPHHEGRDTFLIDADRVAAMLRHKGYGKLWAACLDRVRVLLGAPAPEA